MSIFANLNPGHQKQIGILYKLFCFPISGLILRKMKRKNDKLTNENVNEGVLKC